MNILITRPLIDSEDLMGKFFSLGHKIMHIPTLKITSANMNYIDANNYDAFIFTSINAVRNLNAKNLNKSKICFCVGAITEKVLRQNGYSIQKAYYRLTQLAISFLLGAFIVGTILK